jgi:hypothetical protein
MVRGAAIEGFDRLQSADPRKTNSELYGLPVNKQQKVFIEEIVNMNKCVFF